jgi:hypothetical protein
MDARLQRVTGAVFTSLDKKRIGASHDARARRRAAGLATHARADNCTRTRHVSQCAHGKTSHAHCHAHTKLNAPINRQ